ncbi:MAG TPA: hypothetical protein VJR89_00830 [Polyangiales bacterium]|nr:hypothetical protein [Polyangiales bacterium]
MDIERVDIAALLRFLATTFRDAPPQGEVVGRSQLRDAVTAELGCSQLQAEQLVDTLVMRGCLRLSRAPGELPFWRIVPGGPE